MKKTLINNNFECKILAHENSKLDISCGISADGYQPVDIPHDALVGDANSFYTDKVIWYRRKTGITPKSGKRYIIYFEGVYMDASIYINEQYVGKWVNGYTSFYFDITDYVNSPDDYLYVCINYQCPNSRWYGGPGINRNVWLYEANEEHFAIDSLYVCPTLKSDNLWDVNVSVDIATMFVSRIMSTHKTSKIIFHCDELGLHKEMLFDIIHSSNNSLNIVHSTNGSLKATLRSSSTADSSEQFSRFSMLEAVSSPSLWDTTSPHLYSCYVELQIDGKTVDTIETRFGFRHIEMSPDTGMTLNGQPIKLNGVCLHSDQGCLGTAFHKDMQRYQLQLMKEMGVNAIRQTHNVHAPGFLDLCDELGLLVLDEAFDCWKRSKTQYDYGRFFEEWSQKDIKAWIMRDRNHPCVFMWSAGNEIYDTHADEDGAKTLHYINDEIRKHDFFDHAPVTLCSNYMAWDNTINAVDFLKIAGYNYGEFLYDDHHKTHPDWIIFGSETASVVQSRGIYHFPLEKSLLVDDDEHCSSLGNCCTSWGAPTMDFCITTERDTPYSLGQFLWTGIDYLGEPTPYHTKSSYFGVVDTACFPKDVFYLLQSSWRSFEECPVIHILPYWDFNEGQLIDIRVCSNAPSVELFFNDKSLGKKTINLDKDMNLYADYQIPYQKGVLRAVGYDVNGNAVIETTEASFGDTDHLKLSILNAAANSNNDLNCISNIPVISDASITQSTMSFDVIAGDTTIRLIELEAYDEQHLPVRNACDRINVSVSGPAKLIGLCNGNQTDMESFKGTSLRLFSGKLLAVIKPNGESGVVNITADIDKKSVYVRKLNISTSACINNDTIKVCPDNDTFVATVNVYPTNAQYKSIEYQITNESGVPIKNAIIKSISDDGLTITIQAVADAHCCLRAMCREADDRVTVISRLEFEASGFGELLKNPFEFVSASLFDDCVSELGNGNEKGIATSNIEDSYILYDKLDFGITGSREVTIPIFELGGAAVPITFWEGMPHAEGSKIIGKAVYHKPSIWNVYQEETFILDEPLFGVTSFGIEISKHKIHIKGFTFNSLNTTYDIHYVNQNKDIYGDQYNVTDDMITGIGNNVCIMYKDMDFGENGAIKISITGHTPLANNTIHIRFNNGSNEQRQIIEFPNTDSVSEITFDLEPITGKGDLSFIFLPGSDFDFKSFEFKKE